MIRSRRAVISATRSVSASTSLVGISTIYDDTDGIRPTRGQRATVSQDFAGLGGDVRYLRTRADATKYKDIGGGWVLSGHVEGGIITALQKSPGPGQDAIRLTDRFFGPDLRGFDIRGIGPRIERVPYDAEGNLDPSSNNNRINDALGGRPIIWVGSSFSFGQQHLAQRRHAAVCVHRRGIAILAHSARDRRYPQVLQRGGTADEARQQWSSNTSCTQFNGGTVTGYADDVTHSAPGSGESIWAICRSPAFRSASA